MFHPWLKRTAPVQSCSGGDGPTRIQAHDSARGREGRGYRLTEYDNACPCYLPKCRHLLNTVFRESDIWNPYMLAMRRKVALAVLLVSAALLGAYILNRLKPETYYDRQRITSECKMLSSRVRDTKDNAALRRLVEIMRSNWQFARVKATFAIGTAGPEAIHALDDLIQAAEGEDLAVRREAILAIGKVSKGNEIGVAYLESQLGKDDHVGAAFAAIGLGEIGKPAIRSVPALQRMADTHPYSPARHYASIAIEQITKQGH